MKKRTTILSAILLAAAFSHQCYAQADFTVEPQTACTGSPVVFTNTSQGSFKFAHFDFGDNTDTYGDNLQHIYTTAGDYTISMWLLNNDGTKSSPVTKTIKIDDTPSIEIEDSKTMSQITVTTDQSVSYEWYLGKKKLDNTENPLFYYESGNYSVIIRNASGCEASAEIRVTAQDIESANNTIIDVVNNVITPGVKDGINDVLFIKDVSEYEHPCVVMIYDKRGKLVYTNFEYSNTNGFQGIDKDGNDLFAGTYYYVIKSEGRKGVTGFVDIIR